MEDRKQKLLAFLFIAGGLMVLTGLPITASLFGGGGARTGESQGSDPNLALLVICGPLLLMVGLGMLGTALTIGLRHAQATKNGPPRSVEDVHVVARYALNEIGEMIFSEIDAEDSAWQLFVRLQFSDGHIEILRCPPQVFYMAGEGMNGSATVKGDWLGQFIPAVRPAGPLTPFQ